MSRLAAVCLLTPIALACPPKHPKVTEIEIVPSVVMVGPGPPDPTTFELEARLWTGRASHRIRVDTAAHYTILHWKVSATWLRIEDAVGHRVHLTFDGGAPPSDSAFVTVEADGKTSPRTWVVVANAKTLAERDVVSVKYAAGQPPTVALATTHDGTGACGPRLFPLVRQSRLGKASEHCTFPGTGWDIAALAVDHPMVFATMDPAAELRSADLGPAQGTAPALSVPVTLRVVVGGGGNPGEAMGLALADVETANAILRDSRAGLVLTVTHSSAVSAGAVAELFDCVSGDIILDQDATAPDPDPIPASSLHVYYVPAIAMSRGLTCAGNTAHLQQSIFISMEKAAPSTLVHEVGHALGLTLPGKGHSDLLPGFDATNVMTSTVDDGERSARQSLSVGQVFRMNADSGSWLNRARGASGSSPRDATAPRLGCQCGAADPKGGCPRVADDVAGLRHGPVASGSLECGDMLHLRKADFEHSERPIGLLAGRRWRAPLEVAACASDLLSHSSGGSGATAFRFENITRPMGCPSWAAIFSQKHGMLYLPMPEEIGKAWSDVADLWISDAVPPELARLAVRLYYPSNLKSRIKADTAVALLVFGEQNRTGILLDFDANPAAPCPLQPATGAEFKNGSEIIVCYTDLLPGATLPYVLGLALGLAPLATQDPLLPSNVMQFNPGDRGNKLTLGQVFRINVAIGRGPSQCDPGPCPPLSVDAP